MPKEFAYKIKQYWKEVYAKYKDKKDLTESEQFHLNFAKKRLGK